MKNKINSDGSKMNYKEIIENIIEITKDNPLVLKFIVEYQCVDIPYNPEVIRKTIDKSLDEIRKHFKDKNMQDKHKIILKEE